jgi:uncharacterized protein (UPF0332 family)
MSGEFERCIEKAKIVAFQKGPSLVSKELNSATEDLLSSKESFKTENYKWATIQAYYSMFHTSRALIYYKKYREKSHYCLVVALEHLYLEKGLIEKEFIESLILGKEMRGSADYRSTFSKEGADNLIKNGRSVLSHCQEIVEKVNRFSKIDRMRKGL